MHELIISAPTQRYILPAITDKTVIRLQAPLYTLYTRLITIIDDTLFQQYLWNSSRRRSLIDYRLIRIQDRSILQMIINTRPPEINTRPAPRKITVRVIKPIPSKI